DVAPIPLLWVLPLCVYLISFILTFHGSWYRRAIFHPLFVITTALAVISLFRGTEMRVASQVVIFLSVLFAACMFCHGELVLLKYLAHARLIAMPPSLRLAYNIGLGVMICVCVWLAFTGGPNWARRRKFRWSELTLGTGFVLLTAALYLAPGEQDPHVHRL